MQSCHSLLVAGLLCVFILAAGCSTKKNTATSRNWQAFTTRYNVYFNGSEHYKEQLKEMERMLMNFPYLKN